MSQGDAYDDVLGYAQIKVLSSLVSRELRTETRERV
jgi:hypothetical protein